MNRAIGDFLKDLVAGEPVALIFVGVVVLFAAVVGLWGLKIIRDKRKADETHKKRLRQERKNLPK